MIVQRFRGFGETLVASQPTFSVNVNLSKRTPTNTGEVVGNAATFIPTTISGGYRTASGRTVSGKQVAASEARAASDAAGQFDADGLFAVDTGSDQAFMPRIAATTSTEDAQRAAQRAALATGIVHVAEPLPPAMLDIGALGQQPRPKSSAVTGFLTLGAVALAAKFFLF